MQPVAVDDEPPSIQLLEIHIARGDPAGREVSGREADGLRLLDTRGACVGEPGMELGKGRRVELGAGEGAFGVLVCARCGVRAGWGNYV